MAERLYEHVETPIPDPTGVRYTRGGRRGVWLLMPANTSQRCPSQICDRQAPPPRRSWPRSANLASAARVPAQEGAHRREDDGQSHYDSNRITRVRLLQNPALDAATRVDMEG